MCYYFEIKMFMLEQVVNLTGSLVNNEFIKFLTSVHLKICLFRSSYNQVILYNLYIISIIKMTVSKIFLILSEDPSKGLSYITHVRAVSNKTA